LNQVVLVKKRRAGLQSRYMYTAMKEIESYAIFWSYRLGRRAYTKRAR